MTRRRIEPPGMTNCQLCGRLIFNRNDAYAMKVAAAHGITSEIWVHPRHKATWLCKDCYDKSYRPRRKRDPEAEGLAAREKITYAAARKRLSRIRSK